MKIRNATSLCQVALWMLILGGCIQLDPLASGQLADSAASSASDAPSLTIEDRKKSTVASALRDPNRNPTDETQDRNRRALDVLSFFGIERGMTVLDLYSGGGYYTELLSLIVGPRGRVIAHNNTPYLQAAQKELDIRYAGGRLKNVERLTAENNELRLEPSTLDAVIMIKAYHDIYFEDKSMGWQRIDRAGFLSELLAALKPGGIVGIVDHAAISGAPAETGGTIHRIDPERIKRDFEVAGFVFDGQSQALRNAGDDRTRSVFTPELQGRTDRVVMRFRKP